VSIANENDSDLRYSEVPLKGKNKTLVKILGGRQHRTTPAGQILGVATPATPAAVTPMRRHGGAAGLLLCARRAGDHHHLHHHRHFFSGLNSGKLLQGPLFWRGDND